MMHPAVKTRRQPKTPQATKTSLTASRKRKLKNLDSSPDNGVRLDAPRLSTTEKVRRVTGTKKVTVTELTCLHKSI